MSRLFGSSPSLSSLSLESSDSLLSPLGSIQMSASNSMCERPDMKVDDEQDSRRVESKLSTRWCQVKANRLLRFSCRVSSDPTSY